MTEQHALPAVLAHDKPFPAPAPLFPQVPSSVPRCRIPDGLPRTSGLNDSKAAGIKVEKRITQQYVGIGDGKEREERPNL